MVPGICDATKNDRLQTLVLEIEDDGKHDDAVVNPSIVFISFPGEKPTPSQVGHAPAD